MLCSMRYKMIHLIFKLLSLLIFSKADFEDNSPIVSTKLGYKEGIVGNETFVYYYIHYSGNIVVSLTSNNGDADLYISESSVFPTFYPENYDLHSATCGVEVIEIPPSFKSPIAVGVYGHSAHELSSFVLEVLKNPEFERAFAVIEDELPQDLQEPSVVPNEAARAKTLKTKRKRNQSSNSNGFFSLFEILGLIFL